MESVTLNIKGMSCMGCVRSVKNVLEPIAGVSSVDVSLEAGKATLQYDPAKAKVGEFKAAIEGAGYEVTGT
jgi:copper chaperone